MVPIALLAGVAIILTSLVAILVVFFTVGRVIETRLQYLVSFSAGVFLVTAGALALEVFHVIDSWWWGAALIAVGYIMAWLLQVLLPETHHHHDASCTRKHRGVRRLLIGDGLHNTTDGIILVPAFAASPTLGIAVTVSIMVHEALQEISKFFVLRAAGYSVWRALILCTAVSSSLLIGVGIGYLAITTLWLEGILLALSSGFLFHVVIHDLWPRRHHYPELRDLLGQVAIVVAGVLLMVFVHSLTQEAHTHGHDHHGGEHEHEHESHEELHHHDEDHLDTETEPHSGHDDDDDHHQD